MRLKNNKTLAYVADYFKQPAATISKVIINGMVNGGFLKDDPDNYGCMLSEVVHGKVFAVAEVLTNIFGLSQMPCGLWDKIFGCIVIGDGDCPECGGKMELYDYRGHEMPSGDRDLPPEYVTEWEQWRCPVCGHIIEKDLS